MSDRVPMRREELSQVSLKTGGCRKVFDGFGESLERIGMTLGPGQRSRSAKRVLGNHPRKRRPNHPHCEPNPRMILLAEEQMPRSDLLLSLVRAGRRGDRSLLRKTVEAIAAEERAKRHNVLADQLIGLLNDNSES